MTTATSEELPLAGWPADVPAGLFAWDMAAEPACCLCAGAQDGRTPRGLELGRYWDSQEELRAMETLRAAGLHVHAQDSTLFSYWADMVLPLQRLVVEYDGGWVHDRPAAMARDEAQRALVKEQGWRMIRLRSPELPDLGDRDDLRLGRAMKNWGQAADRRAIVQWVTLPRRANEPSAHRGPVSEEPITAGSFAGSHDVPGSVTP